MLINVKMATLVGILPIMSMINFKLSWVEHEKSFITLVQIRPHLQQIGTLITRSINSNNSNTDVMDAPDFW